MSLENRQIAEPDTGTFANVLARFKTKGGGKSKGAADQSAIDPRILTEGRYNFLKIAGSDNAAGGLIFDGHEIYVWGYDLRKPNQSAALRVSVDGRQIFQRQTAPESELPIYSTGYRGIVGRTISLSVNDVVAKGGLPASREVWSDSETRADLLNFITDVRTTYRNQRVRHHVQQNIPNVSRRLDRVAETESRIGAPAFIRYLANRTGMADAPKGALPIASWIVSDLFEDSWKRQIFCLTDQTLQILNEAIFNRRIFKQDISLTLFAFWRRHYQHIDILTDEGLRLVQYKLATAPYILDKNNINLLSPALRTSLSRPSHIHRNRELPWSWYWVFFLTDQGLADRMGDDRFSKVTSFKETVLDVATPQRLSFNPAAWRAYWGSGAVDGFTRFDRALISILGDVANPEMELAERGPVFWRGKLRDEFYSHAPELAALSGVAVVNEFVSQPVAPPTRDLVLIGHPNDTGVGRNLGMFVEATEELRPLILSADDGSCVNPDASYDPAIGLRAKVVVMCVRADRVPEVIARFASVCEDAYIIGFFLWESDRPPADHTLGALAVDEIWAPSEYCADAYRKVTTTPVSMIRKGIHPQGSYVASLDSFRRDSQEFIFLCAGEFGSSIVRKNPLGVINAFQRAFPLDKGEHVFLLLKIREIDPQHWSNKNGYWEEIEDRLANDHRIRLVEGNCTAEEMATLFHTTDVLVSLHLAEGFGYFISDAMLVGKAVIVSDYSGTKDFCDASNAYVVPVQVEPCPPELVGANGYCGQWAMPDIGAAAEAMREAYEDRPGREIKAIAAKQRIEDLYGFRIWKNDILSRVRKHLA